jgi:hypothetical protein
MPRLVQAKPRVQDGGFAAAGEDPVKAYLERVAKYVPSEIVAGYITVVGMIAGAPERTRLPLAIGVFALCFVLTPIYLNLFAKPNQPRAVQLTVGSIAFIVWAYAVTRSREEPGRAV